MSAPPPSVETIQAFVARYHGLTVEALAGRGRSRRVTEARHLAMYLCLLLRGDLSAGVIGRLFQHDASTVRQGLAGAGEARGGRSLVRRPYRHPAPGDRRGRAAAAPMSARGANAETTARGPGRAAMWLEAVRISGALQAAGHAREDETA